MPNLINAQIKFFTPKSTDDKDDDTIVRVKLYTSTLILVAEKPNIGSGIVFPDNNTYSDPFLLDVVNQIPKNNIDNGNFSVSISPNGDDTWYFRPVLTLYFSDGTQRIVENFTVRKVSEDAPDAFFVF